MSSVSVIIPTFNAAPLIERTLRSVISQNGGHDIEMIIVDDASTDNTLDVIASLAIPSIKILQQDGNHGPAAARNRGLSEATGEFMAFLDGDDHLLGDLRKRGGAFGVLRALRLLNVMPLGMSGHW